MPGKMALNQYNKVLASFKRGNLSLHHPCKKVSVTLAVVKGGWQRQTEPWNILTVQLNQTDEL